MSSQLETVVLHEFFTRAACESVSPKNGEISSNGSLETETIQKFLSICLKQYFSCSEDGTKVRFPSSEILNVNIIYYFHGCGLLKCGFYSVSKIRQETA